MIPAITIQSWRNTDLPANARMLRQRVQRLHPTWRHLFFDDPAVTKFLWTHYPTLASCAARTCRWPIQVIDIFRLCAVHHFGGFWLDLDMELYSPLQPLRRHACVFAIEARANTDSLLQQHGIAHLIGNYAFGATPQHESIELVLNTVHALLMRPMLYSRWLPNPSDEKRVFYSTGPVAVTLALKKAKSLTLLRNAKTAYFGRYGRHVEFGTWK
jgi:hypothetical protein